MVSCYIFFQKNGKNAIVCLFVRLTGKLQITSSPAVVVLAIVLSMILCLFINDACVFCVSDTYHARLKINEQEQERCQPIPLCPTIDSLSLSDPYQQLQFF